MQVKAYVDEHCAGEFESNLLDSMVSHVKLHFLDWLQLIFGEQHLTLFPYMEYANNVEMPAKVVEQWSNQLEYHCYKSFAEMR